MEGPPVAEGDLAVVLEEAERHQDFARRLEQALGQPAPSVSPKRPRSRTAALVDPVAVLDEHGEKELRARLHALSLDQLLDVAAEFGMDPARLVMKWRSPDRVADHIIESANRRSVKGDAFRAKPTG